MTLYYILLLQFFLPHFAYGINNCLFPPIFSASLGVITFCKYFNRSFKCPLAFEIFELTKPNSFFKLAMIVFGRPWLCSSPSPCSSAHQLLARSPVQQSHWNSMALLLWIHPLPDFMSFSYLVYSLVLLKYILQQLPKRTIKNDKC